MANRMMFIKMKANEKYINLNALNLKNSILICQE